MNKLILAFFLATSTLMPLSPLFAHEEENTVKARATGSPWLSTRLLTPHLTVKDVAQSKKFYETVFGFTVRFENLADGKPVHVEMAYMGELAIMFVPENVRGRDTLAPASFTNPQQQTQYYYLYVENVDETVQRAKAQGATIIEEAHDAPWGDRFALIVDPNGYHWGLAQAAAFPKP